MKTEEKTKTVYIANDGTEFFDYSECAIYEEDKFDEALKKFEYSPVKIPGFLSKSVYERKYAVVTLNTEEEFKELEALYNEKYGEQSTSCYYKEGNKVYFIEDDEDDGCMWCEPILDYDINETAIMLSQIAWRP